MSSTITTMNRIAVIYCPNENHYQKYTDGSYHPEQPMRVLNAQKYLTKKYPGLPITEMNKYNDEEIIDFLGTTHDSSHMDLIKRKFEDMNSAYSVGDESFKAVLRMSQCLMTMCDLVEKDIIDYAICVVRPPGHHCCNHKPAGFCLINTAIVSAKRLIQKFKKVSIFEIDLHHGGGTQKEVERNTNIMYTSIHNKSVWSDGLYKKGINGVIRDGRIINVALPVKSNDSDYLYTSEFIIEKMEKFTELCILSAGFDAHKLEDGVGFKSHRMNLSSNYYGKLGNMLKKTFNKTFVILEGGYNEEAIAESLGLMIEGFMGREEFETKGKLRKSVEKIVKKLN